MSNRIAKSTAAVFLALAAIGAAHADGFYGGASVGTPDYKSGGLNGINGSGSGVGGKIYGGYQITPNLAVEAGVADLGHIDNESGKVNLRGTFADAVGKYEVAPKLSVLGRVGVAEGNFVTTHGDDSSTALKLGAGLQYDLTRKVALRAEYEHYRFANAFDNKPEVGEYSLGVNVAF